VITEFFGFDPDSQHCGVAQITLEEIGNQQAQVRRVSASKISTNLGLSGSAAVLAMIEQLSIDHPALKYAGDPPLICTERMEQYANRTAAGNNLLMLEQVSGAWQGIWKLVYPECKLLWPYPKEWKGTVPKKIHHKRLIRKLGLTARLAARSSEKYHIDEFPNLKPAENYHALDAVGLALHGAKSVWGRGLVLPGEP